MSTNKTAWVQLYQARQVKVETAEVRSPGRPPSLIPRRKVGVTLSHGEISELDAWQERLSALIGRKLSTGETMGILLRLSAARYSRLADVTDITDLVELVERMIGES